MFDDIESNEHIFHRSGKGSSQESVAKVTRNEYAKQSGMEGYDYSFVNVKVKRNGKTRTIRQMFSKSIDSRCINESEGRVSPQEVLRRHAKLKELHLPVPPTLRVSEDGKHILMTDMTEGGKLEIVDRHNTYSETKITNLEEIEQKIIDIARNAQQQSFVLSADAYAVLVNKQTGTGRVAILDIGSGIYSQERLQSMYKEHQDMPFVEYTNQVASSSAETFNFMLDLMHDKIA